MQRFHFAWYSLALGLSLTSCKQGSSGSAAKEDTSSAQGTSIPLSDTDLEPTKQDATDLLGANFNQGAPFERLKINENQKPGLAATGTPVSLRGIWWMDGNPSPDCTVSFAKMDFSQDKPRFAVFGENNFSWHAGTNGGDTDSDYKAGMNAYNLAKFVNNAYEFQWTGGDGDKKYDSAVIIPTATINIAGITKEIRISTKILKFTMTKVDDDHYKRENFVLGFQVPGYDFRRIFKPSDTDPNTGGTDSHLRNV